MSQKFVRIFPNDILYLNKKGKKHHFLPFFMQFLEGMLNSSKSSEIIFWRHFRKKYVLFLTHSFWHNCVLEQYRSAQKNQKKYDPIQKRTKLKICYDFFSIFAKN